MKKAALSIPEIGLIAATRGMLGAGVGLLTANSLSRRKRKLVGRVLLAIGVASTVPLVMDVVSKLRD